MSSTKEPSAAQKLFGDFNPKLAELTDRVLFADVSECQNFEARSQSHYRCRPDCLEPAETSCALTSSGRANGVTKDEVVERLRIRPFTQGGQTR